MSLAELIHKRRDAAARAFLPVSASPFATATVATVATVHLWKTPTVASVATVANPLRGKEGGKTPTVASVATVAVANPLENVTVPTIEPTHRTTVDLIFNDPATGNIRTIPAGTPCRRFSSPNAALMAGVPLDFNGNWAANKNIERGYCLIWVEGALRGVHFSDVETILERTTP